MLHDDATSPSAGTYTVIGSHVPQAMAVEVARVAEANCRSVSGEIRLALKKHLADVSREITVAAA